MRQRHQRAGQPVHAKGGTAGVLNPGIEQERPARSECEALFEQHPRGIVAQPHSDRIAVYHHVGRTERHRANLAAPAHGQRFRPEPTQPGWRCGAQRQIPVERKRRSGAAIGQRRQRARLGPRAQMPPQRRAIGAAFEHEAGLGTMQGGELGRHQTGAAAGLGPASRTRHTAIAAQSISTPLSRSALRGSPPSIGPYMNGMVAA